MVGTEQNSDGFVAHQFLGYLREEIGTFFKDNLKALWTMLVLEIEGEPILPQPLFLLPPL